MPTDAYFIPRPRLSATIFLDTDKPPLARFEFIILRMITMAATSCSPLTHQFIYFDVVADFFDSAIIEYH